MVLKRKRNLKVDNVMNYAVHNLRDLEDDALEDYVEVRDTGMEADEEKEIHLQKIIQEEASQIPLPEITVFNNPARSRYKKLRVRKKIRWMEDCPNAYIYTAEEEEVKRRIKKKIEDEGAEKSEVVFEKELKEGFMAFGETAESAEGKHQLLVDFVLRRVLLRYDIPGLSAYSCFKPRIFNPSFKPRRNEALIMERLKRMGMEFKTLDSLCGMLWRRMEEEERKLEMDLRMLEAYHSGEYAKGEMKMMRKQLLGQLDRIVNVPMNIHRLMTDRERIRALREQRVQGELFLGVEYCAKVMDILRERENGELDFSMSKNDESMPGA